MATTGTEKYSRIALTLIKGGTKLTRRFLEKRIKDLSQQGQELTIDEFLLNHKTTILKSKTGKNKRFVYFPSSGTTDLEQWDLHMFCFILLETCGLTTTLCMYIEKLQKIRNKLCHMKEPTLEDDKFEDFTDKLEICFKKCLKEIDDPVFTTEMDALVKSFQSGPLALDDSIKLMHTFFHMEYEQRQILEKHSEEHKEMSEKMDRTLEKLQSIDSRLPEKSVDVPGMGIVIEVKNCSTDKENEVLGVLVKHFNDIVGRKKSSIKENLPNGALHTVREAVEQTFKEFLTMGRHIVKVEQKCVMLTVKCASVTSFVDLLRDYRSDTLKQQLHGLESAIRSGFGCKDAELETVIYKEEFWNVIDSLVSTLDEQVKPRDYAIQPFLCHNGIPSTSADSNCTRVNGMGDIHLARTNLQDATANTTKSIRLTVHTSTPSHQKELEDYLETPVFETGMKRIETEIGKHLEITDMSITARVTEIDSESGRSPKDQNKSFDSDSTNVNVAGGIAVESEEGQHLEKHKSKAYHSDLESLSPDGEMDIYSLIDSSCNAMFSEDRRRLALQAIKRIDLERDNFLTDPTSIVSADDIADWYSDCANIFYQIEDYVAATKCYYSAMVFDPEWDYDEHLYMSDMLWGILVFFRWNSTVSEICQDVEPLLEDLDKLAEIAEKTEKWSVCVAIDGDIDTIYYFLNKLRRLRMVPFDIKKQPCRKAALWRQARCYLKMGLHGDLRKSCIKILQEACDYDDMEALEIWARSLYQTEDFDLAFDKCKLALKYCKHATEKERLKVFLSEIQVKRLQKMLPQTKEPDPKWLEGTSALQPPVLPKSTKNKQKKKHKRPKARFHPEHSVSSKEAALPIQEFEKGSSDNDRSNDATLDLQRRERGENSITSLKTPGQISDVTSSQFQDSVDVQIESEAESDWESFSEEDSAPGDDEDSDADLSTNTDLFLDQSRMSFYEQSLDDRPNETLYQRFLESGVKLSQSYLKQFDDKRPNVLEREDFYVDFLPEAELGKMIRQNPKKYITCVIRFETSHEAYCTPVDSSHVIKMIEISGRSKIGQVFNEDEVVVELLDRKGASEKRYGKVIGVLKRKRHANTKHPVFLCTLDDMESHLVRPLCKTVPKIHVLNREISRKFKTKRERGFLIEAYTYDASQECFCQPEIKSINPADQGSYLFLVAYIQWGTRHIYPRGAIVKILPKVNGLSAGLDILNLQYDIPNLYEKETAKTVSQMLPNAGDIIQHHKHSRQDLTDKNIFTVDEAGRTDLNYAFSVVEVENGYKIGVHVSDVSTSVQRDSYIDKEAKHRGTTFRLGIGKDRHMLPEPISLDICSLLQNEVRLTISIFLYISKKGIPMQMTESNYKIIPSYIKSKRHLTYEEAEKLLSSQCSEKDDKVREDIKTLISISSKMRQHRLGNATYALDSDFEVLSHADSNYESRKVRCMVEEILVTANKKITNRLLRSYKETVPLLYTPQPNDEAVKEFLETNQFTDLLLKLQNKQIGHKTLDFNECLRKQTKQTTESVMLSETVWKLISSSPKQAAQYIGQDDLHPVQFVTSLLWKSVEKEVEYECSGPLKDEARDLYTIFTSPLSSYMDLVVQRLIHAAVFQNAKCPYSLEDLKGMCVHINSIRKKARAFQKACQQLDLSVSLRDRPVMVGAFVNKISDRGLTLCSPLLKNVLNTECELPFNLLDVAERPVVKDECSKFKYVTITWKKRLYDFHVHTRVPQDRGYELKLNPHKDVVFIPLSEWARMLKCTVEQNTDDLLRAITQAHVSYHEDGLDDVSTECFDTLNLRPNTKFAMIFTRGQQVKAQLSAEPSRGMLTPKLMLYNMTKNVKFCLQHTDKPVLHLYRYATLTTCEKYETVKEYLKRWVPILIMESATGAVRNEESFCINNVPITFTQEGKGEFSLGLPECEARNIEFSGTASDDEDCDDKTCGKASYDWLCLKTTLPDTRKKKEPHLQFESIWVGHARIKKVSRRKVAQQGGKLIVKFSLHKKDSKIPQSVMAPDSKFNVEVLRKSEVDRRTESFIKILPNVEDSLAMKIALNSPILEIDKSRKHIADVIERDLYYDASSEDLRRKQLPRNNPKQQEAVDKALTSRFSLIQGPPGTGKTNTGIKLIYLFNRINYIMHKEGKPKKQVLFCGPSNKSVDLVAIWMLNRMGNKRPNFVRVYGRSIEAIDFPVPGRTFQSKRSSRNQRTSPKLFPVALHHLIRQKGKKHAEEINKMDKMFKETNYAPMPLQVKKYVHLVREASIDEIRRHDVILCTTAVGSNPKVLQAASVYQVIVDEAGMCPEPQCLVPIIATKAEQVVLIGDHNQLRPIIMCKEAASLGLETSLFERYAKTNMSENVQFTMLEDQYRMHPRICSFPSKEFYDDKLETKKGLWYGSSIDIWPQTDSISYPHILVDVEGVEETLTVSTEDGNEQSKSNAAEVDHVVKVYAYLIEKLAENAHKKNIHVLSQYNAQCSEIKRKLQSKGFDGENVSTVVSSQGGEWDYVIFSTVRSLPEYKIEKNPTIGWCQHNLGFITDKNQINVAITRARKGLIIIGNKKLLQCDKVWRNLIQYYQTYGCVMSTEQFRPTQHSKQSTEESQYGNQGIRTSYIGASISKSLRKGGRARRPRTYFPG